MTPAEWLIALLISWWVLRGGLADLVAAARGAASPRMTQGRAAAASGGRRYGMGGYLADLWSDGWTQARARREARLQRRLESIHAGASDGPGWRQRARERWAAAWSRWEHRMADRWQARQDRDGPAGPEPVTAGDPRPGSPGEPDRPAPHGGDRPRHDPVEPTPGHDHDRAQDDGWTPSPRDHDGPVEPPPADPWQRRDDDEDGGPARLADPQTDPLTPDRTDRRPQELEARPGPDGRWEVDPNGQPGGAQRERGDHKMAEVTGLATALAHASEMRQAHEQSVAGAEQYAASLAAGGVTGEALAAVEQAMEAQQQAAAAWAQAEATLGRHVQVRESYQANPDAGTREFVTAE